jgi:hypothetical protein
MQWIFKRFSCQVILSNIWLARGSGVRIAPYHCSRRTSDRRTCENIAVDPAGGAARPPTDFAFDHIVLILFRSRDQ